MSGADHLTRSRRQLLIEFLGLGAGIAVASCFASGTARAAGQTAADLIRALVDEAFEILRDPKLASDRKARMERLRAAADKAFDWAAMAQGSLGPHWRKLDAGQRREFISVFEELLARQYMDDLDRFRGTERVQIQGTEAKDTLRIVKTILVTDSHERIPMDYTLQPAGEAWRVSDLSIEGISLVNHYRESFARFLVNKSFAELMQQLKRKLGRS